VIFTGSGTMVGMDVLKRVQSVELTRKIKGEE
jgi:hypothetical protein